MGSYVRSGRYFNILKNEMRQDDFEERGVTCPVVVLLAISCYQTLQIAC